jgi:hypothetical protein
MQRLFLPIALIVMVLVGAWLIWPQPEPRALPREPQVGLESGARLRIRYEGSGVGRALVRRASERVGGEGVEGGRSALEVVPPGKLTVEFRYPGVEAPEVQECELAAGEERELVFKAPPAK